MNNIFGYIIAHAAGDGTAPDASVLKLQGAGLTKTSLGDASTIQGVVTNTNAYDLFLSTINIALMLMGFAAFIMLIWTGAKVLMGASELSEAKDKIIKVFAGLLIIITSYALVNTILTNVPTGAQLQGNTSNTSVQVTQSK